VRAERGRGHPPAHPGGGHRPSGRRPRLPRRGGHLRHPLPAAGRGHGRPWRRSLARLGAGRRPRADPRRRRRPRPVPHRGHRARPGHRGPDRRLRARHPGGRHRRRTGRCPGRMLLPGPGPSARPAAGRHRRRHHRQVCGVAARLLLLREGPAQVGHAGRDRRRWGGGDRAAAHAGAQAAPGGARPPRRPARPGRYRPGRPGRRLGQGGAHRPGQARRPDGAAAREMATHHRPGVPARGRSDRSRCRPGAAGRGGRPGRDLRAVRGLRGGGPARRGPAGGAAAGRGGGPARRGGRLMRLHTLELRAFGPYATGQRIDFDRLAASGLFLLEGPTGAGKSTVLDAITFALYGGLAGDESGEDRLRSHFADPAAEPSVMLEFSLHGTRYRVTRAPEHRRPKKRGEGFTTEASRVHLERMEAGIWRSLTSNKAEAGELVTEAVGLNREQFTQVMLLPQGEFARFLRARDDDRRELLTKLFGTQLYDRVTAELDRWRYDAARRREEAAQAVSAAVSAAAEAAGLDAAGRAELLSLPRADRETRLKEESEGLAETMAVTGEGLELAVARVAASRAAAERAGRQASLMARLTQALADLRGHEETRAEHDRRAAALDAARRAEPVRPLLTTLAEANAAAGRARDELLSLIPGPSADMLAGHGGAGVRERAAAAERDAAGLQHLADVEDGLPAREAELAAQEEAARKASDRVAALEEARGGLPARIAQLEGERDQVTAAAGGLDPARARLEEITVRRDAACAAAELAPEVEAAHAARQAAVDAHQVLVDAHQAGVNALLGGMAAELAAQLTAGEPCPVCGSPEHPAPAHPHADAVSANDVAELAEQRDEAERGRARLEEEWSRLDRERADLTAATGGRAMEELATEAEALASAIA